MRVERFIQTWGTVIVVDAAAPTLDEGSLNSAIDKAALFFHHVDEISCKNMHFLLKTGGKLPEIQQ